jgi:hypothetical protein
MLAQDEPAQNDETYVQGGFTFIVEKGLMKRLGKITIDSSGYGFLISSPAIEYGSGRSGPCL